MYKSILVPLDGSQRAELILSHVEELARQTGSRLVLLQVVEAPSQVFTPGGTHLDLYKRKLDQADSDAKAYLAAKKGALLDKGIETRVVVRHGPVVDQIIKAAESQDVDLVAIASHGRSGLEQVFYGSVTAGILNRIDRPLLLIRAR